MKRSPPRKSRLQRTLWIVVVLLSIFGLNQIALAEGRLDEACRRGVIPACDDGLYCESATIGDRCRAYGTAGNRCRISSERRCDGSMRCSLDGRCYDVCQTDDDCNDHLFCNGREVCRPGTAGAVFGCVSPNPPCDANATCDEVASRCVLGVRIDDDGDGRASVLTGGDDCDDDDPTRYPGAAEICDVLGKDEDCDPTTYGNRDADQDGFVDSACYNR